MKGLLSGTNKFPGIVIMKKRQRGLHIVARKKARKSQEHSLENDGVSIAVNQDVQSVEMGKESAETDDLPTERQTETRISYDGDKATVSLQSKQMVAIDGWAMVRLVEGRAAVHGYSLAPGVEVLLCSNSKLAAVVAIGSQISSLPVDSRLPQGFEDLPSPSQPSKISGIPDRPANGGEAFGCTLEFKSYTGGSAEPGSGFDASKDESPRKRTFRIEIARENEPLTRQDIQKRKRDEEMAGGSSHGSLEGEEEEMSGSGDEDEDEEVNVGDKAGPDHADMEVDDLSDPDNILLVGRDRKKPRKESRTALNSTVIPDSWWAAANSILHQCECHSPAEESGQPQNNCSTEQNHRTPIIAVIGPKNAGKSTFARFLLNFLLNSHEAVAYLDTDVGQPEFTVPGCLSLHIVREPVFGSPVLHLRNPERSFFYGDVSPKGDPEMYSRSVVFWKWITPKLLGLVTQTAIYHWAIEGESKPVKMFDRTTNLNANQIINYLCDPSEKWLVLIGIAPGAPKRPQLVKGNMQLFSVDQQRSQALEAHAASFATFKVARNETPSTLISFATKTVVNGQLTSRLHVIELGALPGKTAFTKKQADLFFPPDFADDFPVAMQISQKYGLIYVITKLGLLFVYDLETATAVYRNRISPDPIFLTADAPSVGGFYAVNRRGQVLLATVNEATIVPFVSVQLSNLELAVNLAKRGNLPGAENLVVQRFQELFSQMKYQEAAELAAESPQGILRIPDTVARFQSVPVQPGQTSPLLQYFGTLLTKGKLNVFESLELSRLVVNQNKKNLLENWLAEDKLECSEELGDLVKTVDSDMALKIYIKARATPKVIQAFAERKEFDKILIYSKQVGYTPDYLFLLQTILRADSTAAVNFALMMAQMEGGSPVDYNVITDLFLQRNMIREATSFLLDVLKPNLPEHGLLQTKVLEINLVTFPNVADAILANGMFSHYDRPRIAQLCEKAGLYMRALQHYADLVDIKRVVINTHAIEPQALVEFFGTLSKDWALDCMKELLLVNMRGNLQIIVQVAKEYSEQLGVDQCVKLFEQFKSYEGLYFFLGSYLSLSEDPEIHFKYIEAAAKTGQIKEVERVTRESNFYDPERTKNFLMEARLPDARPLINVCDRHGFVPDLTHYLYSNNMLRYIEGYVQKVNPSNAPLVVGQLLDDDCPEDFIKGLILSVRSLLPVEPLVNECEKRNRLRLLTQFLEHLVSEGSQDVHVHNALGKIIIDTNHNPEHFLTTNPYYDSRVVGKYCEKRDPTLAVVAYRRGLCDEELVNVTNKNSLFKLQARYVVERMEPDLWAKVLDPENPFRRQLIDQVVSTALPESKNPEQVSATVKAFMTADLPHELIELLEKIVLQNSAFSGNPNLQNLLILTAIKADKSRVMDYINRLDNFDGPAVGAIAVDAELYEEAFAIFKKFNLNVQAVNVLLDNIRNIDRAVEFANRVEEDEVWSQVGKAQLKEGLVSDAIESFIRANDATQFNDVILAADQVNAYEDLVKYLLMVRKKVKEPKVDSELIYAWARIDKLSEIEEFLVQPNVANLQLTGDRLFDEALYEAAKIIFTHISNWARLASTLVKLGQYQGAVDAARKANSSRTWKEVCFACVDAEEFRLAQICGLNIIVQVDDLEEVSDYYQNRGRFDELITLMETGLGLERAHMGIFTELGTLYARYRSEKLMEHIKLFSTRINIPKLIRVCDEQQHWKELTYLYIQYDEFDNAAATIMNHSPEAWDHMMFKDVAVKVANVELYYKAAHFYLQEHPDLINDLLNVLAPRVDHTRVVDIMRKAGQLPLVKPYMVGVQSNNVTAVNEALNELYVEEEDYERLHDSIDMYDNFDQIGLAQRVEKHELLEMRRIAAYIYKKAGRWKQSVALSKKDNLYKDAMETTSQSGDRVLAEELLTFFVEQGKKECFASCLYTCYDLIRPDVALELAWFNNIIDFAIPYVLQFLREYTGKVDELIKDREIAQQEVKEKEKDEKDVIAQTNMYAQLLPLALPAPEMPGMSGGYNPGYGGMPQMPAYGMPGMGAY